MKKKKKMISHIGEAKYINTAESGQLAHILLAVSGLVVCMCLMNNIRNHAHKYFVL